MREPRTLSEMFLAAAEGDGDADTAGIEAALAAMIAAGQQAFPALPVDIAAFVRHVAKQTGGAPERLAALHGVDLYLACAAAAGDPAAIAEIERSCFPAALAAVARVSDAQAERDDITQMVRQKLFVAEPGAAPVIAAYTGRGPLGGWIRVIAVRTALGLKRASRRSEAPSDDDALLDLPVSTHPELEHMRARYRSEFKEAFQAALSLLSPRERNLLRLHFLDGLNLDELGTLHRVHRATVARWLARSREALFEQTRRRLTERLGLSGAELESLVALVQSQVDISLLRFLKAEGE